MGTAPVCLAAMSILPNPRALSEEHYLHLLQATPNVDFAGGSETAGPLSGSQPRPQAAAEPSS